LEIVGEVGAEAGPGQIVLYRRSQGSRAGLILEQHAEPDARPYIHPIVAPDGHGLLTENAPSHHPWQHGLYVGLNDVNGAGFWTEGLARGGRSKETDGTFHPAPLAPPWVQGNRAGWSVESEWRSPGGAPLLAEVQQWRLVGNGETYTLDMVWTLRGLTDVTFGQYAYGGLFLRMPYRPERGGTVVSSEGLGAPEGEGKRARWVAVSMPIEGRAPASVVEAGIAILDHPGNPEHPSPWRVDSQLGICPSRCIAGQWRLGAGETTISRYRVLVFCGPPDPVVTEQAWAGFSRDSQ
jgi:hypothetical protein